MVTVERTEKSKSWIKTASAALLFVISIWSLLSSVPRWRAELKFPIEKSSFWRSEIDSIPKPEKLEQLKKALELAPQSDGYHLLAGKYYLFRSKDSDNQNRLEDAKRELLSALKLNPYRFEILSYLGWLEFSRKNFNQGVDYLEAAIRLGPSNYYVRAFYGFTINQFIEVVPQNIKSIYIYRARQELKRALEINQELKRNNLYLNTSSRLYILSGDFQAALKELEDVDLNQANNIMLSLRRIDLYLITGQAHRAIALYTRLLQSKEKLPSEPINNSLKRNAQIYPGIYLLQKTAIEQFIQTGQIETAEQLLNSGLRIKRSSSELAHLHYLRGLIYEQQGNNEQALGEYRRSQNLDVGHRAASQRLVKLLRSQLLKR